MLVSAVACADTQNTSETTTIPPLVSGNSGGCGTVPPTIVDVEYMTFEEMCASVDYIALANCTDGITYNDHYAKFTYNIKECIFGELPSEIDVFLKADLTIKRTEYRVTINGEEHFFSEDSGKVYTQDNEDVVIFLVREENLEGFSEPQYTWYRAPIVNLTNLADSEMYNKPIAEHMTGFEFDGATAEEVLAYIKTLAAKRTEN